VKNLQDWYWVLGICLVLCAFGDAVDVGVAAGLVTGFTVGTWE
jgi:hypothetical protein